MHEESYCLALFVGFLGIEITEQLYSKVALFGTKIRKIYGRITGNQLPVPVPLFLREPVKISHMAGQDRAR